MSCSLAPTGLAGRGQSWEVPVSFDDLKTSRKLRCLPHQGCLYTARRCQQLLEGCQKAVKVTSINYLQSSWCPGYVMGVGSRSAIKKSVKREMFTLEAPLEATMGLPGFPGLCILEKRYIILLLVDYGGLGSSLFFYLSALFYTSSPHIFNLCRILGCWVGGKLPIVYGLI